MAVNMENPLQPSFETQLARTVQDTQGCIEELRKDWEDSGLPLTDDSQTLQRFSAKLEYLLQAGMKSKSSLIGGKKDYWNYISDCISGNKGLNDGLRFVKSLSELKTNLGRGRAFVRFCLVHHRLADTLQQCVYNHKVTNDWYLPNAVWLNSALVSALINALYDLNDLQFDLAPSGYDLDTSWPTFARKTFNQLSNWSPPSRTISVSSLASTQDVAHSFTSEAEVEKYKTQLNDTENERLHLQVKLDSVEDVRTNLERKISELEIQLTNSQRTCNQFEVTCDKLETELKLREETWVEKEALWKARMGEADKSISELGDELKKHRDNPPATPGTSGTANTLKNTFEATEARVKLATEQRTNSALRIDLKSAHMELKMKEKVDTQKTTLIELLERKVLQMQTRNNDLFEKLEDSTSRPMEAQEGRMNTLLEQLKISEKANEDMLRTNTELRKMLNDLEDKSRKVAQLAKEKVLKYVDQNKILQETVDDLTGKLKTMSSGEDAGEVARLMEELSEAKHRIEELEAGGQMKEELGASGVDHGDSPIRAMKFGYERLQERIQNGDESESLIKIKEDKAELEKKLEELEAERATLRTEKEELNSVLSNKNTELADLQQDLAGVKGILTSLEKNMASPDKDEAVGDSLMERTQALVSEYTQLSSNLQMAESRVTELTEKLRAEKETSGELEQKLSSVNQELDDNKVSATHVEVSVGSLETKIKSLQDDLEVKVTELEGARSELGERQGQIESLKQELDNTTQELDVLRQHKITADETIANNNTVIQNLQEHKVELEKSLESLSGNQQRTESRSSDLDKHNKELESQLREVNLVLESKSKEYGLLEKHCAEVVEIKGSLLKDKEKLQSDLDSRQQELDKSRQEKQDLNQKLVTSEGRINALEDQVALATQGSSALDSQLAALHEEVTALKGNKITLEADIQTKQNVIEKKEKLVNELTEKLESSQESLEEYSRSIFDTESQLTSLREERDKLQVSHEELNNQLKATTDEMEQTRTRLEGDISTVKQRLSEADLAQAEALSKLEARQAEWDAESSQLKGEVIRLEMERNAANQSLEEAKRNASVAADEIVALKEGVVEYEKGRELLQSEVKERDESLATLRTEVEQLKSEMHTAEQLKLELEARVTSLTEEVDHVSVDKNNLMSSADLMKMKVSQMENMMEAKEKEVSETWSDLQEKKKQLGDLRQEHEKLQEEKRVLQSNLDATMVELGQLEKTLEFAREENMEVHEKLQQSSSKIESETESAQKTIQELSDKVESLNNDKSRLEKCIEEFKNEKEELSENIAQKDSELSAHVSELERLKAEHQEMKEKICSSEESWQGQQNDWEKTREALESEVAALKFEMSTSHLQRQTSHKEEIHRQLSEHEVVVDQLETQLQDVSEEYAMQEEKIKDLESRLEIKEGAYNIQSEQLQQLVEQHQELVDRHRHFQEDLEVTMDEHNRQVHQFEEELDLLKTDNERLREQLVKIVKDKASLWQQKDQLDVIRRMVVGAKWMDSGSVTHCLKCNQEFTFLLRKHHCRLCGRIFCYNCCDNWILTAYSSKKERTCDECVMAHSLAENAVNEGSTSDQEDGEKGAVTANPSGGSMTHSRTSITSGLPENTETVAAADLGSIEVPSGVASSNQSASASASPREPTSMTTSAIGYAADWLLGRKTSKSEERELPSPPAEKKSPFGAEATVDTSIIDDDTYDIITDFEHNSLLSEPEFDPSVGVMSKSSQSGDDPYDVITQDEIIESLHESIIEHDPKMMSHGTIRADELEDGVVTSDPDLWVKPGLTLAVPIIIPDVGYKLHWTFKTQPKDIGFGMTYKECLLNYDEEGSVLIQTIKCNSHKRAIEGELVARQTGVYTLLFDNTHSRFTHKQLEYTLRVHPPGEGTNDDLEGPPDTQTITHLEEQS